MVFIEGSVSQKVAGWQACSPRFEIALVFVRLDHIADGIVTGINTWKNGAWADLFVTLGFGSVS